MYTRLKSFAVPSSPAAHQAIRSRRVIAPVLGLVLLLAFGPSLHAQESSEAEPMPMSGPIPATRAFAEQHDFASEWMGELVYSSDGAILGVVRDLALRDGSLSHVVMALEAHDGGASNQVAVPVSSISINIEYGIRRVVTAQREMAFLAHLR